ncbi:MAG: D-2-hydroxyacid dehydrogenase [Pseudomonadales bacterium]|jgi:phosphoglycerate dehydrogenase-like enzyme|nr:D-2-hydroxyacid dehydrogenase [Pseudomonadales bacterium]
MPVALYFKPTWERLAEPIRAVAPSLRVGVYDEDGHITLDGQAIGLEALRPQYFWIHSELVFSKRLRDYFQVMLQSPSIEWLHTINAGLDKLPYLDLLKKGVRLTNNHAQAIAIAEFVLGQVLARFQDVADYRAKQAAGVWQHRGFREIKGSRWVLVGFGAIGRELAQRLRAFGAHITAVRRTLDDAGLADAVLPTARVHEALAAADVVVLACAATAATRNLVDARFLGAMNERSLLVNIARGDLVVEADLRAALDAGRPAYAILDVFNQEPPAPASWVWRHPRVSLTPHTSNAGSGMRARAEALFLDNLRRQLAGEALVNQVSRHDIE